MALTARELARLAERTPKPAAPPTGPPEPSAALPLGQPRPNPSGRPILSLGPKPKPQPEPVPAPRPKPVPSVPTETPITTQGETGPLPSPAPVTDQESAGMASEPVSDQGEGGGGGKGEKLSAVQAQLAERWPALFGPGAPAHPLKVGIHLDILAAMPDVDPRLLKVALGQHCGRSPYVNALLDGGPRYGLDGEPCGEVTEAQIEAGSPAASICSFNSRARSAPKGELRSHAELAGAG